MWPPRPKSTSTAVGKYRMVIASASMPSRAIPSLHAVPTGGTYAPPLSCLALLRNPPRHQQHWRRGATARAYLAGANGLLSAPSRLTNGRTWPTNWVSQAVDKVIRSRNRDFLPVPFLQNTPGVGFIPDLLFGSFRHQGSHKGYPSRWLHLRLEISAIILPGKFNRHEENAKGGGPISVKD